MRRGGWRAVPTHEKTFTGLLNNEFLCLNANYPRCLPEFEDAGTLLLGSDYSGEHSEAPYMVYSFLMTSLESWANWEPIRLCVRQIYLRDSRRMSYKRLSDGQRRKALIPLLEAANTLRGLSFSIALNKQCVSVFAASPPLDLNNPQFAAYQKWKPAVLDKAFFVLHVFGVLLAGLASAGQNVMWFTDEDSIAANDDRVRELTQLFAWISSQYLTFTLGHCRCGTSRCDNGSGQIEDFLAIPDLIAGALSEQLELKSTDPAELSNVFWMSRGDFSDKTRKITWWLSDSEQPLKRFVCVVDPTTDGKGHMLNWFHFHDQK
ncbi:MAG: hypothetical protein NTX52_05595 [Planctomycetota bacterium]|nr:hypothetical protein [Planctomycetota bacterium]